MIDSIYVATSGMLGSERALNVISNNVSNLNTPGFRGSSVNFANVFSGSAPNNGQGDPPAWQLPLGGGVDASQTVLDTRQGTPTQTGKSLDLYLQGEGFFVLRDANGAIRYTREGSFSFNSDQVLVSNDTPPGQTLQVMSRDANGNLVPIDLKSLQTSAAKPTRTVTFANDLSPNDSDFNVNSVVVYDAQGAAHTLRIEFLKDQTPKNSQQGVTVTWTVNVFEGDQNIGTSDLAFSGPTVTPGSSPLFMSLNLQGSGFTDIEFDFGNVSGQAQPVGANPNDPSSSSNLSVASQDGLGLGTVTSETFDNQGTLQVTYSNGQTAAGAKLLLAQVADPANLVEVGNSLLTYRGTQPVALREAGADLQVNAQALEGSNVDLTREFSSLILMQRGYQGASQVVSTANDMLQQLLSIRTGR
jgi:flagellar hook protein FlgE